MADDHPPFRVECPDCDVASEAREFDESAEFVVKHREHTGHLMEWSRAEFGLGLAPDDAWALTCETCGERWSFDSEREALAFREDHAAYTDHEIESDPVHEGPPMVEGDELAALIDDLGEHFDHGVPEPLVIVNAGGDVDAVRREIQSLKRQGTVFERSPFRLVAV